MNKKKKSAYNKIIYAWSGDLLYIIHWFGIVNTFFLYLSMSLRGGMRCITETNIFKTFCSIEWTITASSVTHWNGKQNVGNVTSLE